MSRSPAPRAPRLAVIDIGSNTTTLAVYEVSRDGSVDRVLQRGDALRLLRAIGPDRSLSPVAIDRTIQLLRGFSRVARDAGAPSAHCIATSAVRDARNGAELLARIRAEPGLTAELLSEEDEGLAASSSVVNQLPVTDGCMIDLGGGSLQVVEIVGRRAVHAASLPLGALRSTDLFFKTDPPSGPEVTALRRHVLAALRQSCPWVSGRGTLVAVGGTPRAFAKIHRRQSAARINHSHGYRLDMDSVESVFESTSRLAVERRREVGGLSPHRVDVMPAGALTVLTFMRCFGYPELVVSHYGVREGVALRRVLDQAQPLLPDVRDAGLHIRFPALLSPARAEDHRIVPLAQRASAELGIDDPAGLAPVVARLLSLGDPDRVLGHLISEPLSGFFQDEVLQIIAALSAGSEREPLRVVADVAVMLARAGWDGSSVVEAPGLSPAVRGRVAALRRAR